MLEHGTRSVKKISINQAMLRTFLGPKNTLAGTLPADHFLEIVMQLIQRFGLRMYSASQID